MKKRFIIKMTYKVVGKNTWREMWAVKSIYAESKLIAIISAFHSILLENEIENLQNNERNKIENLQAEYNRRFIRVEDLVI